MSDELQERFDLLLKRLSTSYDGIGHSSGRPYLYFIYPPTKERQMQRLLQEQMKNHASLSFHHIDILHIAITSLQGQEERRQQLLDDPLVGKKQNEAILHLWANRLGTAINKDRATLEEGKRPVVVLYHLAALHPLGDPTSLMEFLAEKEPRDPRTGKIVPIVLLIPGSRPPQSSRAYIFLDQHEYSFYRGEEI